MRFLNFFVSFFSVVVRLVVAASPFAFLYFHGDAVDFEFIKSHHLHLWAMVWFFVSMVVLFARSILAAVPLAGDPGVRYTAAAEVDEGRHFDFMRPGTHEYNRFHYGDVLDDVNSK